jgi:CRISPR-associated protein Cmr1
MKRTLEHPCPPVPEKVTTHPHSIEQTYTIKVITPLFGGGVEAGVPDPITLIRPSSIRGHLRFWWRATRGTRCNSVAELRQREGEIWGTSENPSPVIIKAETLSIPSERRPNNHFGFNQYGPEAYTLFSAKQNNNVLCHEGFAFSLTLCWLNRDRLNELRRQENVKRRKANQQLLSKTIEDISLDIEAALWAWVNFGGIGARTRRGCGALYCTQGANSISDFHPSSAAEFSNWLRAKVNHFGLPLLTGKNSIHYDWPIFPNRIYIKETNKGSSLTSWQEAIGLLKRFRQGIGCGRDPGKKYPGRSRWPEAESVRELIFSQRKFKHRPRRWHDRDTRIPTHYFPRAEFGMPIIFELRGEHVADDQHRSHEESQNIKPTLQPAASADRMASPLILRPLCFSDGQTAAMIAVLNTVPATSAYLKPGKQDLIEGIEIKENRIRDLCLVRYPDSPLSVGSKSRPPHNSALQTFLVFAKENGFTEHVL